MTLLKDKVAIVTGSGSGIGRAIALKFANEGAKVIVSDINETSGEAVLDEIKKVGGEAFFVKADTANPEDSKGLVEATVKKYGRLDIACNNAGIGGAQNLTGDYKIEDWNRVININLNGVFYGCHYQIQQMLKNGGGSIINMSSILGSVAAPYSVAYTAAKHGVVGLSQDIGAEYAKQNIRCNSVAPGYIATPLLKNDNTKAIDDLISKHPMGRLGKPEEVAELVTFLASDKASFITSSYYLIDGGYTAV